MVLMGRNYGYGEPNYKDRWASAAFLGSTPTILVLGEKYLAANIVPLQTPPPPILLNIYILYDFYRCKNII